MKQRVLTAIGLIAFVLITLFSAFSWPVFLLAAAFYVTGMSELAAMLRSRFVIVVSALIWAALFLAAFFHALPISREHLVMASAVLFLVGITAAPWAARRPGETPVLSFLASGWVAGPISCLVAIHHLHESHTVWRLSTPVLLAMAPLWAGDTAAIFAGKYFGKHKLWPALSPKKTWEGAAANLVACIAAAIPLGISAGFPPMTGLACGIAAGTVGQYGDLFESHIKRLVGLKDSGTLLPGHGGVLDRIDSLLFTAPAVGFILFFWPNL